MSRRKWIRLSALFAVLFLLAMVPKLLYVHRYSGTGAAETASGPSLLALRTSQLSRYLRYQFHFAIVRAIVSCVDFAFASVMAL